MKIDVVGIVPTPQKTITLIKKTLTTAARALRLKNVHVEVFVVGDTNMKKNVLAYPAPDDFPRPDLKKYRSLGEIYLNPGYIKQHKEDVVFMAVHGLLHLLGFDHHTKRDTMAMEKKEQELLKLL